MTLRVCVYGAGAVGGHIAGRLARGGADVSVIARGPHLAAMQADGLTVEAPDATMRARLTATEDPRDLGPQDAVVVVVKAPALPAVAAGIAPLLGPDTKVVFAINGIPWWYFHRHGGALDDRRLPSLDPGDVLRRAIGMERVVGCVIYSACTVTAPGVVHVANPTNRLVLGAPDGAVSAATERLAGPLRASGLTIELTAEIRRAIWAKLLLNLSSAAVSVLTGSAPIRYTVEPAIIAAQRAVIREGAAIAAALGCALEIDVDRGVLGVQASRHKASILQDLEAGRPMEIDAICTVPLELARLAGVATPTLDLLVALTKVRARAAGLYGTPAG